MRIDWSQKILDENDEELSEPIFSNVMDKAGRRPFLRSESVTLGFLASRALLNEGEKERLTGEDRNSRGLLALKIKHEPESDINIEDLALVKRLIGEKSSGIAVTRAWIMLEE